MFATCAIVYFNAIEGLVKPAGIGEALEFLISSPKEYALCLACGVLAKISFGIMVIVAIASVLHLIIMYHNGEYYYKDSKIKDIIRCIINGILTIVIGIAQAKIILNLGILVLTIGLILLLLKLWIESN